MPHWPRRRSGPPTPRSRAEGRRRTAGRRGRGPCVGGGGWGAGGWPAGPRALRAWALAHPHEWGLVFGTPVPGYEAPQATVEPYARVAAAMVRPLAAAQAGGRRA